jgi:flavodoxin
MKGLIIYYSWTGNTAVIAEEMQRITGFDLQRIEKHRNRSSSDIIGAAMSAIMGLTAKIKELDYKPVGYDHIILGTPVWAGKTPPEVNTILKQSDWSQKKVWLIVTKADEKSPDAFIQSVILRIAKKGGDVIDSISFTSHWTPKDAKPLKLEEISDRLESWARSYGLHKD